MANFNSARDAMESVELAFQGLTIRAKDYVPLTSAREALRRLELSMEHSRVDMIIAQNNYAAFVTSEAAPRGSFDQQPDPKGKAPATALDAILDNLMNVKKILPEPEESYTDNAGKIHKQNQTSFVFCQRMSFGLWKLLDALRFSAEQNPNGDQRDLDPEVKLSKLIPLKILEDNSDRLTARLLIEIMLNDVTKYSNVVYLKYVHVQLVSDTFVGDKMYGSDRTLPIFDRVDASIKRV